jgi:hypothetical protein
MLKKETEEYRDAVLLLQELIDKEDKDREVISKVKDIYFKLTGIRISGCLCSYAVRTKIYNQANRWLQDNK